MLLNFRNLQNLIIDFIYFTPKTKKPSFETLTSFFPTKILALGSVLPNINFKNEYILEKLVKLKKTDKIVIKNKKYQVLFIKGIGEVFPYIRAHNLLTNLQKILKIKPKISNFLIKLKIFE